MSNREKKPIPKTDPDTLQGWKKVAERYKSTVKPTGQPAVLPEPKNDCQSCGGLGYIGYDVPVGHALYGQVAFCPDCGNSQQMTWLDKVQAERQPLSRWEKALTMDQLDAVDVQSGSNLEFLLKLEAYLADPFGFFTVYGPWGNGKTDALHIIRNQCREQGIPGLVLRFSEILGIIRLAYDQQNPTGDDTVITMNAETILDRISRAPYLGIDELGFDKTNASPWAMEKMDTLIQRRYAGADHGLLTGIATNVDPAELGGAINDRVRDGRFVLVENTAPSARPNLKRQRSDHGQAESD